MTVFFQTAVPFLLTNALWLFSLGTIFYLAGRKWRKHAAVFHLLWVLLLVKMLLPPVYSVELGVWNVEFSNGENKEPGVERSATSGPIAESVGLLTSVPLAAELARRETEENAEESVECRVGSVELEEKSIGPNSVVLGENAEWETAEFIPGSTLENPNSALVAAGPEVALRSTPGSLFSPLENSTLQTPHSTLSPAMPRASSAAKTTESPHSEFFTLHSALAAFWAAGSLLVLAVAWRRIAKFRRCLAATEPADDETQRLADEIAAKLGLARPVPVRTVEACMPPMVWAFFAKPVVLFPKKLLAALAPEQRALLLAHELAHLRRRDHWVRCLELACTILYWWHPMLRLARRELREAEELCCDAWATWLFPGKNRDYGRALLATIDYLSEDETVRPVPLPGSGMSLRETQRRMEMILKSHPRRTPTWPLRLLILVAALLILPFSAKLVARQTPEEPAPAAATQTVEIPQEATREAAPETPSVAAQEHRLAPGDSLLIYVEAITEIPDKSVPVYLPPSDSGLPPARGFVFSVRDDGTLSLPKMQYSLNVEGMTIDETQSLLRRVYVDVLKILGPEAEISVSLMLLGTRAVPNEILTKLEEPYDGYYLPNVSLQTVLDRIHRKTDIRFVIESDEIKPEKITINAKVPFHLPLRDYLDYLARQSDLSWHYRDMNGTGVIAWTNVPPASEDGQLVYRAYYISDLARRWGMQPTGDSWPNPDDIEAIADYVRTTIAPKSWNEEVTIKSFHHPGTLIIRQTNPVHVQIANLLVHLRNINKTSPEEYEVPQPAPKTEPPHFEPQIPDEEARNVMADKMMAEAAETLDRMMRTMQEEAKNTIDGPKNGRPCEVQWQKAAFRVVEEATGEALAGVTVTVKAFSAPPPRQLSDLSWTPHVEKDDSETFTFVTDKDGMVTFRFPQKLVYLDDKTERSRRYEIWVTPIEKDGKVLHVGWTDLWMAFDNPAKMSKEVETLGLREAHLLIGRVIDADSREPMGKTDDGNPIRVGFLTEPLTGEGYPLAGDGHGVVEVGDDGMFQCNRPAGVNWPFLLPNGEDILWTRTVDHQRWQQEGVLVKPGNITTLTFSVKRRLDKSAPSRPTPVAEELPVARKLIALDTHYTVNERKHIDSVIIFLGTDARHFDKDTLPMLGQLPELNRLVLQQNGAGPRESFVAGFGGLSPGIPKVLTADMLQGFPKLTFLALNDTTLDPEVIERIAEMEHLQCLHIIPGDNDLTPLLKLEKLESLVLIGGKPGEGDYMLQGHDAIQARLRGENSEPE